MFHKNKSENLPAEENETSWLGSNLYRLMLIVTVVWFAIVMIYITQFFGWSNLFLMMPDEFGGFLAGATLPLALIWVGMAYVDRSAAFKREAKFLRAYMNQLVYPEQGESATAKAMGEAIRSQVAELQEVTKLAMSQTAQIKKELDARVDDFASLVKVLDNYSTKSIVELTKGVKTLTKSFDGVAEKAFKTTKDLSGCIDEFSSVAGKLQGDISGIVDSLLPSMREIKNSADVIQNVTEASSRQIIEASENLKSYGTASEENFNLVYEKIQAQGKFLADITEQAVASTKAVGDTFTSVSAEIDNLIESKGQKTIAYAENMDNSIQEVCRKISEHSDTFVNEAEKIIAQTSLVEGNLSSQTDGLKNIADKVSESLQVVQTSLNQGLENLSGQSSLALENMTGVAEAIKNQTSQLVAAADEAYEKLDNGSNMVAEHLETMQGISADVNSSLDAVNVRFDDNVKEIKAAIGNMIENLEKINTEIATQSEKLTETGNIAVTQSRLAESSLAEQHVSINSSLQKVENMRQELNRQIEELTDAAAKITGETQSAVDLLKDSLTSSVEAANNAAEQAKKFNADFDSEVKRLDKAADEAVEKIGHLENTVSAQGEQLRQLVGDIDERTAQVKASMEKHGSTVNEATSDFSAKFADIVSTFEEQSKLLDNAAGNAAEVSRSIREQIVNMGESADAIFAKMSALESEVERRGSDVADKSNVAIDKLSEIDTAIAERVNKLDSDLGAIEKKQKEMADMIAGGIEKLSSVSEELKQHADESVNYISESMKNGVENIVKASDNVKSTADETVVAIAANTDKIKAAHNEFGTEFSVLVGQMDEYADKIQQSASQLAEHSENVNNNFAALIEKLSDNEKNVDTMFADIHERVRLQHEAINDNFSRQREDLMDAVNLISAQTRLGEAALNGQYKCLTDAADGVSLKMTELSNQFKQNTNDICADAAKLSNDVSSLSDKLTVIGHDMDETTKASLAEIERVGIALSGYTDNLNAATDNAAVNMNKIAEDYQQCLDSFAISSKEVNQNLISATDVVAEQNQKMLQISNDTKSLADYFNALMDNLSNQLIDKANLANDKVKELADNLQILKTQLEESANSSAMTFAAGGDNLKEAVTNILDNAQRVYSEIKAANDVFAQQSQGLTAVADLTLSRIKETMENYGDNMQEFENKSIGIVERTENFNNMIKKQIEVLDIGAKQASNELADIEKRYREMKVENFLKDATSLIEKLESLAIDINLIFNPDAQDKLWQKYYEGDTDVFARYLARSMSKKQIVAVKDEYEKNSEFRKVVNAYMNEFEELISSARSCERSEILLSVISGADIGKIYYIIARALDKLN